MGKMESYANVKKEIGRTGLRLQTIKRDYERDNSKTQTKLEADTCDLIIYSHIPIGTTWENLTTKQRIMKRFFEDESYSIVIFPYHAYEFINYVHNILQRLYSLSSGERLVNDFINSCPVLSQFFKAYHTGNHTEAGAIWKSGLFHSILSLAEKDNKQSEKLLIKPIRKIINLIDNKKLLTISDVLGIKVDQSLLDYSIYNSVVGKLGRDPNRVDLSINNDIDALTAGLSSGLNRLQDEYYFSLSTLASAPLSAYSRSMEDEKTSFCRNTSISSYRVNISDLYPNDKEERMKYVVDSLSTIEALINRFDSLQNASTLKDLSLSGNKSAESFTSVGLLAEFFYKIQSKIVSPIKSSVDEEPSNNFWHFAEVLSDENAAMEGFNIAIREVIDDIRVFTEKLKSFALSQGGLEIVGLKIESEIDNILFNIDNIGKQLK